jgi:hypothetical protein
VRVQQLQNSSVYEEFKNYTPKVWNDSESVVVDVARLHQCLFLRLQGWRSHGRR